MTVDDGIIIGGLSALSGALAAGVPLYLKLRDGIRGVRKAEQDDADARWQRSFQRAEDEIGRLTGKIAQQEQQLDKQQAEISALELKNLQYLADRAELSARVTLLTQQVTQLQKISTAGVVQVSATVTAGLDGIVTDADEAVKDILGWRAAELIGKSVDVFIPRDLRGRHHAGLERARMSGSVRPYNTPISSYALTRTGDRIPVLVSLNIYKDEAGRPCITAQIFHRIVFDVVDVVETGSHEHAPLPGDSGVLKAAGKPPGT